VTVGASSIMRSKSSVKDWTTGGLFPNEPCPQCITKKSYTSDNPRQKIHWIDLKFIKSGNVSSIAYMYPIGIMSSNVGGC